MFEHYTDGDVFDCAAEPGWAPPVGQRPGPVGAEGDGGVHRHQRPACGGRGDQGPAEKGNEVDLRALRGLIKAMSS